MNILPVLKICRDDVEYSELCMQVYIPVDSMRHGVGWT